MALLSRIPRWFLAERPASDPEAPVDPAAAFARLQLALGEPREALLAHPLYDAVADLGRLRAFMEIHVYAVWDFMCLAKRLQRELTSTTPLWLPPAAPALARFINGVIHGEESDVGPDGEAVSHCELYIGAMEEVGADTRRIRRFLELLGQGVEVEAALAGASVPIAARRFVRHTLGQALEGEPVEVLAAFLFGREDLIPDMFARLLPQWRESRSARKFTYYVERHIELDGDDHGPAARRALMTLAGDDAAKWRAAGSAAREAIAARVALWNAVHAMLI